MLASKYYFLWNNFKGLRSVFQKRMKKYKIKTVTVTLLWMERWRLIRQEDIPRRDSTNDDIESLFGDLRLGKRPIRRTKTYSSPKLAEEELKLVEKKDLNYMKTFQHGKDADVSEAKMKMSKSDSKFVDASCYRDTFKIKNYQQCI